jgi:hypothetical protein
MPSSSIAVPETMPVSADDLLLDLMGRQPDPRARRGRHHTVAALVAVAVCAVLTGAKGFTAMADRARDAGNARLGKLGMSKAVADESTFRRVFARFDVEVLDLLLGAWAMTRATVVDGRRVFAIAGSPCAALGRRARGRSWWRRSTTPPGWSPPRSGSGPGARRWPRPGPCWTCSTWLVPS